MAHPAQIDSEAPEHKIDWTRYESGGFPSESQGISFARAILVEIPRILKEIVKHIHSKKRT